MNNQSKAEILMEKLKKENENRLIIEEQRSKVDPFEDKLHKGTKSSYGY